jgi:hypothetical protein
MMGPPPAVPDIETRASRLWAPQGWWVHREPID